MGMNLLYLNEWIYNLWDFVERVSKGLLFIVECKGNVKI